MLPSCQSQVVQPGERLKCVCLCVHGCAYKMCDNASHLGTYLGGDNSPHLQTKAGEGPGMRLVMTYRASVVSL